MREITPPPLTEATMEALYEITSDGIWDWNTETGYVYRNSSWYAMLGYDRHSLDNSVLTWEKIIHQEDYERVMQHFDNYLQGQSHEYCIEYRVKTRNGDYRWIEDKARIVARQEDGQVSRMIGAHRDIHDSKRLLEELAVRNKSLEALVEERTNELIKVNAELEKKIEEVQRLAETDALTGVANRYRLEHTLKHEVERATRFREPLSVIALDIDDFKNINDQYGHATGDMVLIELTKLLKSNIREIDLLARWGGDEFMIILPNTALDNARQLASKLNKLLAKQPLDTMIKASVSIGVAQLQDHESAMRLSIRADNALYQSKSAGKNRINVDMTDKD